MNSKNKPNYIISEAAKRMGKNIIVIGSLILLSLSLTNCAQNNLVQDGAPEKTIDVSKIPNPTPHYLAKSRYGNPKQYTVLGKTYHVLKSARGYDRTGIASWYGTKFHGLLTSTRETYDLYGMTAANKVLPLPCFARVTNLDNGRMIIVKINDRGPFAPGRIIDLSYAAAKKLDMLKNGTAHVEVKTITYFPHKAAKHKTKSKHSMKAKHRGITNHAKKSKSTHLLQNKKTIQNTLHKNVKKNSSTQMAAKNTSGMHSLSKKIKQHAPLKNNRGYVTKNSVVDKKIAVAKKNKKIAITEKRKKPASLATHKKTSTTEKHKKTASIATHKKSPSFAIRKKTIIRKQVGAFHSHANALRLAKKLRQQKKQVMIVNSTKGQRAVYRVFSVDK